MSAFLVMGGYAVYVWPAYGVAAAVIAALVIESVLANRRAQRDLAKVERRRR